MVRPSAKPLAGGTVLLRQTLAREPRRGETEPWV
jgi:hypothetical protein